VVLRPFLLVPQIRQQYTRYAINGTSLKKSIKPYIKTQRSPLFGSSKSRNPAEISSSNASASAPGATEPWGSRPRKLRRIPPQRLFNTEIARVAGDSSGCDRRSCAVR